MKSSVCHIFAMRDEWNASVLCVSTAFFDVILQHGPLWIKTETFYRQYSNKYGRARYRLLLYLTGVSTVVLKKDFHKWQGGELLPTPILPASRLCEIWRWDVLSIPEFRLWILVTTTIRYFSLFCFIWFLLALIDPRLKINEIQQIIFHFSKRRFSDFITHQMIWITRLFYTNKRRTVPCRQAPKWNNNASILAN